MSSPSADSTTACRAWSTRPARSSTSQVRSLRELVICDTGNPYFSWWVGNRVGVQRVGPALAGAGLVGGHQRPDLLGSARGRLHLSGYLVCAQRPVVNCRLRLYRLDPLLVRTRIVKRPDCARMTLPEVLLLLEKASDCPLGPNICAWMSAVPEVGTAANRTASPATAVNP